jgi:hypothetical protein
MRKILLAFVVLMAALAAPAQAQILYGATGGNTASQLYSINPATGAAVAIGPIGFAVTGLARHPTTNVMYGATTPLDPVCSSCLITVNLATGAGTVIGPMGLTIAELAFSATGVLFGWSESTDDLATINIATGAAVAVGDSGLSTLGDGMSFVGGTLYVLPEGSGGNLYTVNTATGLPTLVAPVSGAPIAANFSAATTHPTTGVFFAMLNASPSVLVTVNVATGVVTNVGSTGITGMDALEFGAAAAVSPSSASGIPTLSEWAMILLGLLLAGVAVGKLHTERAPRR